MKKDYDKAVADFEAALRIAPNDATTRTLLENAQTPTFVVGLWQRR